MFDVSITPEKIIVILFFLGVGFPVHEAAHAFAAYHLGDGTAKLFGRLTLNPIKHFDPLGGTLFVLTALLSSGVVFGWAKPTPVNPQNLTDRRNGEVVVALAGPASNLIMASIAALAFRAVTAFWTDAPDLVLTVLFYFVLFNVALAVFNLIPIPPLDGSTVLLRFFDPATAWRLRVALMQYGFVFILLGVFLLGPQIGTVMIRVATFMLGLPRA